MRRWNRLLSAMLSLFLLAAVSATAQASVSIDLRPDGDNPPSPAMGDHLRFSSTITNAGATPIEGLVAWISLVEIDAGNEQPVDLENWSARKAVTGAVLNPGQSLKTDWPTRLIKGGDFRVVLVAAGIPLLILGWLVFNKTKQRWERRRREWTMPSQAV